MKLYNSTKEISLKKKVKSFLSRNVQEYCENTSIHGLKYIVNKSLYPFERLFFAISFVCVVLGTAYFVAKIYEKWNYTPMIVSINPKNRYIIDEPFPAVTICNLNQASKKKVEKLSEYSFEYAIIQMMCKRKVNNTIADAISDWSNIKNLILETSQSCKKMLLGCKYGGQVFNCTEIFNPIITDNGLCCTFNIVDPKFLYRSTISKSFLKNDFKYPKGYVPVYWSPDKGYQKDLPEKFIPMKGVGIGESLGLKIMLNVEADNYYCSSSDGVGFKILLHNPLEVPHMREVGLLLEPGHETKMSIRTERIESDEYVRNMKQSSRKCFFEDEKYLRIYNAYTEQNCVTECSAGQIYRNCNCIPFFKPMLFDNDSICSFYDTSCVERIRLQTMLIEQSGCALICQGSCNDMKYSSSLFSAPLVIGDFKHPIQIKRNMSNDYWIKNVAIVNIFFKDSTYRSEKNMDFVGATDFLSNIGGIIGLFFGFSFVSLAELIFFAILRPLRMLIVSKWTRFVRSAKVENKKQITHNYGTLEANSFNNQNVLLGVTAWKVAAARNHMLTNQTKNLNYPWQPAIQFVEMAVRERTFSLAGFWKKLKKLKDAYKDNTNEFLRNSTIHGLVYFNKPDLNIFERIFFMLTFMAVVVLSIHFLSKVTEKWSYSPTIASLNSEPDYITDDPFPALTICNMNQALKSKVDNFSIYSQDYAILQTLCNRKANTTVIDSIKNWATVKDFITRVSQPCERMLVDCHFGGIKYNCSHIFRAVLMSEGICCIFNSLDPKFNFVDGTAGIGDKIRYPPDYKAVDWNLENGYQNPLPKYFTPMKAVGKGQSLGLKVILNVESDEYCCSSSNSVGFKIAIHNPNERPDIFETGLLIAPGVESFVRIIPNKMNADEKLRGLRAEDRNCIFINECNLKTFLRYSYINCMYECRTAMAIYYCGCIAPYMAPRSSNSSVCKSESWSCLEDIKLASKIKEFGCGQRCWHSCISKTFRMDVFAATLENGAMEAIRPLIGNASINYVQRNIAVAKFYIEHLTYTSVKQAPYIGPLNVLSSFGGLISVFFGFSFISLAELIYYICIRPCRTIKTATGKTKQGNKGRKSRIQLANRSNIHYVNPYRNPIYTVKTYPQFNREQIN